MPFPLTYSFEAGLGAAAPERALEHLREAAARARMDLLDRSPSHLTLSSSLLKGRGEEDLPLMLCTRLELRFAGPPGAGTVSVRARFGEAVALGAFLGAIPWLMALVRSPAAALRSAPAALLGVAFVWLLLYLGGMLSVRSWLRARLAEL